MDDLSLAEAEKVLAEQDFQRLSKLAAANATSQQELDAAREALAGRFGESGRPSTRTRTAGSRNTRRRTA